MKPWHEICYKYITDGDFSIDGMLKKYSFVYLYSFYCLFKNLL
jgi:hypothetical protein